MPSISRALRDRTFAALSISSDSPAPRLAHLNGSSNTPNPLDGEQFFKVTHPFHPLTGQKFVLLSKGNTYGEPRIFFLDPSSGKLRSLPAAWTDQAPIDLFTQLSGGQAILRLGDLRKLVQFLQDWDNQFPDS